MEGNRPARPRDGSEAAGRSRGRLVALCLALGTALLVAVDVGLRALGAVAPDDPLLFFTRTHAAEIDPFVERDGVLEIRPDWVNDGLGLRGRRGTRAGRQFLLPGFRPLRVRADKPPGTLRIAALGGSTTYGLYVGAESAFPAQLGARLAARWPERRVEVLNLGCPGFASDRVRALLPRVLGLDPDVVIVLTGHNEMLLGDVGPAAGLGRAQRLRAALLRVSTLFGWWNHLLAGLVRDARLEPLREEAAAIEAGEIPTFVPEAVPEAERRAPSREFRRAAVARYAANLRDMLATAKAAGVPLVFIVPVANPRSPPGFGAHPEGFAETRAFRTALRSARALREAGDLEAALARVDEALALSPDHAEAHFRRGEILRALGRNAEARRAYQRAIDEDGRTHRITGPLRETLEQILVESGSPGLDPRERLAGRPAETDLSFIDHLHPTTQGHERIAEMLEAPVLEALGE